MPSHMYLCRNTEQNFHGDRLGPLTAFFACYKVTRLAPLLSLLHENFVGLFIMQLYEDPFYEDYSIVPLLSCLCDPSCETPSFKTT